MGASAAEKRRTYFDNAATTCVDLRVADRIWQCLCDLSGNPSSSHQEGASARAVVESARTLVARLINARSDEIVFTSSGTEADNLGIAGAVEAMGGDIHIVASAFEHPAVAETLKWLESRGTEVTYVNPDSEGIVRQSDIQAAVRSNTRLVCVMASNNVVGTLQPVKEIAAVAREAGALLHVDAVQSLGKVPIDVSAIGVDLMAMSAHKINGPKGVGALYVRNGVGIIPQCRGGGQERGLRSSTENVAGIAGFGEAARICLEEMADEAVRLVRLRDMLIDTIESEIPDSYVIGSRYQRLPGHVCVGFAGQETDSARLALELDGAGFAVSTGSACSSHHAGKPSHVLMSMGFDQVRATGAMRITMGRFNTDEEVGRLLGVLPGLVARMSRTTGTRVLGIVR